MASVYGWIITRDHFAAGMDNAKEREKYNCEGVSGPRNLSDEMESDLKAGKGRAFRLYDDDGELMATGRGLCIPGMEESEEFLFGPLDDYGAPNWGCTEIRWALPGGNWESV
jgi:hypothetical protein